MVSRLVSSITLALMVPSKDVIPVSFITSCCSRELLSISVKTAASVLAADRF